MVIMTTMMVLG